MTGHLQGDVTAHDLLQRWQSEMQQFGIHIKSHLIHHLRCIDQQNTVERYHYLLCSMTNSSCILTLILYILG